MPSPDFVFMSVSWLSMSLMWFDWIVHVPLSASLSLVKVVFVMRSSYSNLFEVRISVSLSSRADLRDLFSRFVRSKVCRSTRYFL